MRAVCFGHSYMVCFLTGSTGIDSILLSYKTSWLACGFREIEQQDFER